MQSIDDLARIITARDASEQQILLEKVAELNFQKGLRELSERYRARLEGEGRLSVPAEQVWDELRRARGEIAERDYPG